MSTKKLQLILTVGLVVAFSALLVSCPAENQPANSNSQTTAPSSSNPAPTAESAGLTDGPGQADQPDNPPNEPTKPSSKSSEGNAEAGEKADEDKPPMSKNYREPKKESVRPKKRASRKKSLVGVEVRFISAEYNDAEDATLSKLKLEFRTNIARKKTKIKVVELDDINEAVAAEFDLGLCRIEIYPVVQPPRLDDVGSLGSVELLFEGMFQVRVYLEEDELIGIFGIYADGVFGAAPMADRPEGFRIKSRKPEYNFDPVPFTIYRDTKVGEKPEYLLTILYHGGGFEEQKVEDPERHIYKYRFPAGLLELYDPNEI